MPRDDLGMEIDGVDIPPFQGFTSWAAFQAAGGQTMVTGEIVLTEPEVNPAMSAALENGLQVTALDNHFFFGRPHVFFMHIGGMGTTQQLSTGVRKSSSGERAKGTEFAGDNIPAKSRNDPKPLERTSEQPRKRRTGRQVLLCPQDVLARHGGGEAITWAVFGGSQQAAIMSR